MMEYRADQVRVVVNGVECEPDRSDEMETLQIPHCSAKAVMGPKGFTITLTPIHPKSASRVFRRWWKILRAMGKIP